MWLRKIFVYKPRNAVFSPEFLLLLSRVSAHLYLRYVKLKTRQSEGIAEFTVRVTCTFNGYTVNK